MDKKMVFDFFYGIEGEQYSFLILPKTLIKDERFKKLSANAIILYCLFLERNTLSQKNHWFDEENRSYIIYTRDQIMEDMNCSAPTAAKMTEELVEFGLIDKIRRGQGHPDIIYVKNFNKSIDNADETGDDGSDEQSDNDSQVVKELYFREENTFTSRSKDSLLLEVKDVYTNNININKTNMNNTDYNKSSSSGIVQMSSRVKLEDDDVRQKKRIGYDHAVKLYSDIIVNSVFFELKNRKEGILDSISPEIFSAICQNIVEYGESVNNIPAYVRKCVDNMIMAMSANLHHVSKKSAIKGALELQGKYDMKDIESWIHSN